MKMCFMQISLCAVSLLMVEASLLHAEMRYRVVRLYTASADDLILPFITGISENGFICGSSQTSPESAWQGRTVCFFIHPDGRFVNLGTWKGMHTRPYGINDRGQMCISAGDPKGAASLRYTPGEGFLDLGRLVKPEFKDDTVNAPRGINNSGQVIGECESAAWYTHAYLYTEGVGMQELGTFGTWSGATAINQLGWVCGTSTDLDGFRHAYLYKPETGMVDLGTIYSGGAGLNNYGVVVTVGNLRYVYLHKPDGTRVRIDRTQGLATLWGFNSINDYNVFLGRADDGVVIGSEAEGIVNIETHIDPQQNWSIWQAPAINNRGQIAATAYNRSEGRHWAIRLDPIPPKLSIRHDATNVVLTWSPAWPDLVLETSLNNSGHWQPVPVSISRTNSVTLPATNAAALFRLVPTPLPPLPSTP